MFAEMRHRLPIRFLAGYIQAVPAATRRAKLIGQLLKAVFVDIKQAHKPAFPGK